jgi:hypothetical protein
MGGSGFFLWKNMVESTSNKRFIKGHSRSNTLASIPYKAAVAVVAARSQAAAAF